MQVIVFWTDIKVKPEHFGSSLYVIAGFMSFDSGSESNRESILLRDLKFRKPSKDP